MHAGVGAQGPESGISLPLHAKPPDELDPTVVTPTETATSVEALVDPGPVELETAVVPGRPVVLDNVPPAPALPPAARLPVVLDMAPAPAAPPGLEATMVLPHAVRGRVRKKPIKGREAVRFMQRA
jgi:hypothetical protein